MKISPIERDQAVKLIKRLTLPGPFYKNYLEEASEFIELYQQAIRGVPKNLIAVNKFEMLNSRIFEKKFLVAFVTKVWFDQYGPSCDAIASPSLEFIDLASPPLVLIPGNSMPSSPGFSSIVEHEFVHVNQGIWGRFPNLNACDLDSRALFDELINVTHAEFEANFLQLVHDQTMMPNEEFGIDLEKWCLLRGYTQGLETAMLRMTTEDLSLDREQAFLKKIQDELAAAFENRKLNTSVAHEFARDIEQMSQIAILNLHKFRPEIVKCKNYLSLFHWIFRKEIAESKSKKRP